MPGNALRVSEIGDQKVALTPIPATRGLPVQLTRLRHEYVFRGRPLPVLNQIDLVAAPGEFVALLGRAAAASPHCFG